MQERSYFQKLSGSALQYAIKDIQEALLLAREIGNNEGKYSDQLYYAVAEQRYRMGADLCPTCGRPV